MSPKPMNATRSETLDRILYVGTDRPHKNLLRVIEAYALARRQVPEIPRLEVIGGMRTPRLLREAARRAGVADSVVLRGHVSDAELEDSYAAAVLLVFPSLAEGFGLPILEAMARSVPVVTSNISACAEVAGDAAITVDPLHPPAIAAAIVEVFRDADLRSSLVARGLARVLGFTWRETANKTLAVLRSTLA